jgi:dTMP kinase
VAVVGRLVAIEGVDGSGKRTLADALATVLTARGATVARMAFPRYGSDIHAELVREALHGRLGELAESVHGMAVLFALDRRAATAQLRALRDAHDVLLLDRYVASNAAYGAARLHQDADGPFVEWVHQLEIDRLGVPVPDAHLLLRVPTRLAQARTARRAQTEHSRGTDRYEVDRALQARCAAVYDGLAARGWLAPWSVLDGSSNLVPSELAARLLDG